MFKRIYGFKHELLAQCLKNHKSRFIINHNDCKFVRKAYQDFRTLDPQWQLLWGKAKRESAKIAQSEAIEIILNKATSC